MCSLIKLVQYSVIEISGLKSHDILNDVSLKPNKPDNVILVNVLGDFFVLTCAKTRTKPDLAYFLDQYHTVN